jgi:hypothetical protein
MSPLFVDLSDGSSKTARTHRQPSSFASPSWPTQPHASRPRAPTRPPPPRFRVRTIIRTALASALQCAESEHALARLLTGSWLAVRVATAAGHELELVAGGWNPAVRGWPQCRSSRRRDRPGWLLGWTTISDPAPRLGRFPFHEPAATSSAETSGTVASALGRRPTQAAVPAAPLVRRQRGSLSRGQRRGHDRWLRRAGATD